MPSNLGMLIYVEYEEIQNNEYNNFSSDSHKTWQYHYCVELLLLSFPITSPEILLWSRFWRCVRGASLGRAKASW